MESRIGRGKAGCISSKRWRFVDWHIKGHVFVERSDSKSLGQSIASFTVIAHYVGERAAQHTQRTDSWIRGPSESSKDPMP